MAEQDLDRNEAATPYKLQKAREKGQVSKSSDVVSALVFTVAVAYLSWQGWDMAYRQFRLDQLLVIQSGMAGTHGEMLWPLMAGLLKETLAWLAPFACAVMMAAVIGNVAQTGPVLSVDPVVADFNRLNPANGIKRVLSMRALFDAARACVKLVLLMGAAYFSLKELAPQFYSLAGLSPQGYVKTLISDLSSLGFKMALLMGVIAAIDWMFTRREFAKQMRMSKREVKDEHKQREGDPRVRARLGVPFLSWLVTVCHSLASRPWAS
jgi:flagellar biosynthetic protein FlhB